MTTIGYTVTASCPGCGGELLPADTEILAPDHTTATARCDRCLHVWRLDLTATCIEAWPVSRLPEEVAERARGRCADQPITGALQ